MRLHLPTRLCLGVAIAALLTVAPAHARGRGHRAGPPPRPPRYGAPRAARQGRAAPYTEHLPEWMQNHSNLSLPDQQRALENESGFRDLPPQTQQRLRNRLTQLYNMNPQRRNQILERNEALERLTPQQRAQWRGAVEQWNTLPIPRRRMVTRAVADLRVMPPGQRDQTIDSPAFRGQFSDGERSMIRTLLLTEPYPPIEPPPNPAP